MAGGLEAFHDAGKLSLADADCLGQGRRALWIQREEFSYLVSPKTPSGPTGAYATLGRCDGGSPARRRRLTGACAVDGGERGSQLPPLLVERASLVVSLLH